MDHESRQSWRRAVQGGPSLVQEAAEMATWIDQGLPDLELEATEKAMLVDAFREALRQGAAGFLEDSHALVSDWGFSLADVRAPTRIMQAREDTSTPAAHGEWLVAHIHGAELVWAGGDHFGPRDDEEMQLLAWTAGVVD